MRKKKKEEFEKGENVQCFWPYFPGSHNVIRKPCWIHHRESLKIFIPSFIIRFTVTGGKKAQAGVRIKYFKHRVFYRKIFSDNFIFPCALSSKKKKEKNHHFPWLWELQSQRHFFIPAWRAWRAWRPFSHERQSLMVRA